MIYLICIFNLIGFILCFIDKQKAIHHQNRIPEMIFYFLGFIGGAYAILLGMILFHHKVKKQSFKRIIYFDLIISTILLAEVFHLY
mgnify:CR=1 FL=1